MAYLPRPGTTAYRVVAYLETLSRGDEVTAGKIAERLGLAVSEIPSPLAPAIEAGLVRCRVKNEHPRAPKFYSMASLKERRAVPRDAMGAMADALTSEDAAEALNDAAVAHARAVMKVRA